MRREQNPARYIFWLVIFPLRDFVTSNDSATGESLAYNLEKRIVSCTNVINVINDMSNNIIDSGDKTVA